MKYRFVINEGMNIYESDSRDSKKHLRDHGGETCKVFDRSGRVVSAATRGGDGKISNVIIEQEPQHE